MNVKELSRTNIAAGYKKNYDCHDDELQRLLDDVYQYIDPTSRYMHRLRINLFTDLMKDLISKGVIKKFDNALDIGCNCGFYTKLISDFGFKDVKGIDIDQPLLDRANEFFRTEKGDKKIIFENLNAENIQSDKKYDFILCTEVIEHTTNPKKVIQYIKDNLNSGGIAIVTLPNAISYSYLLTYLSYKLHRRKINGELRDHLSYPSFRSVNIFKDSTIELLTTSGTNLFHWYFLHKVPGFKLLSRLNFELSRLKPLNYFSQFFFLVLRKR
jgi:2-polyprenyl-3-methyl-5-hydroxy-6-metoxy-1,4-benzoquinol methylase